MKSKTISPRSAQLLSSLLREDRAFFTTQDACDILGGPSEGAVRELLSSMVKKGLLMRIKDGLFHIIPYEMDSQTYFPNWRLVAGRLVGYRNYYIGYYSALQIHELTTQPSQVEQVVVDSQMQPGTMKIRDVAFQFVYHNPQHFFGYQKTWIDDFHRLPVSDLEKTLIDCLYHPDYAGGIVEIGKALFKAQRDLQYDRLAGYLDRFGAQSVRKRLGFLMDVLEINPSFQKELLPTLSSSYVTLDPSLPKEGPFTSKWKIQINQDAETIRSTIRH